MVRLFAIACTLFALLLLVGGTVDAQAQKNQMVKGSIKSVDSDTRVLVINQKVKNETVDRELSIDENVEFVVTLKGGEKKTVSGRSGLILLEQQKAVGSMVQVKCDKDVNVLSVKVTIK
jgi:hypothetical protein